MQGHIVLCWDLSDRISTKEYTHGNLYLNHGLLCVSGFLARCATAMSSAVCSHASASCRVSAHAAETPPALVVSGTACQQWHARAPSAAAINDHDLG